MTTLLNRLFLLLVLVLGTAPLRAQLDPRLRGSATDFLNLYQQSTTTQAKPEIVSIFDFSGSMTSLMCHPLYRNDDKQDADAYRYLSFALTDEVVTGGTPANNRYWITGRAGNDWNAYTQGYLTISNTGTATFNHASNPGSCRNVTPRNGLCNYSTGNNIPPTVTVIAWPTGNGNAWSKFVLDPVNKSSTIGANNHTAYKQTSNTRQNNGTYQMTTFSLNPATGPWAAGSVIEVTTTLTHTLVEGEDPNNVTINWSIGNAAWTGGATVTQLASNQWKAVRSFVVPDFVNTVTVTGDLTRLAPITITQSSPFANGSTITLKSYFLTQGNGANNNVITWSVSAMDTNNLCTGTPPAITASTTAGTTLASATLATTTVPAWCANSPVGGTTTPAYVKVTLNASASGFVLAGLTYPGNLVAYTNTADDTRKALRKPDGSPVTETDAANASTTSGLYGATFGRLDVRNWIRAASHVRFQYTSGSTVRTIDLPIPWKVMDRNSSGTPLTSLTYQDRLVKTSVSANGTPVETTYGSGLQIEPDLTYKLNEGSDLVLSSSGGGNLGNTAQKNAVLNTVAYRPTYIAWLFNGKYQNTNAANPNYTTESTLIGKHVAFDALANNLAGGQGTNAAWGQGFGPAGSTWGGILVPKYNLDGTYRGVTSEDASGCRIPAVSRVQATKQAAIRTWIAHQHEVYWAFRTLDVSNEAGGGSASTFSNSSATTLAAGDPTTTRMTGSDSGWTVLNSATDPLNSSTSGPAVTGMKRIASLFASGSTPLTYAMARTLAQYNDLNSVFNAVYGATGSGVSQCVNPYLLLFTDGVDNNGTFTINGNGTSPYIVTGADGQLRLDAAAGNRGVIATKTNVNRNGPWWNLFSFAGIGAHLADPDFGAAGVDYMAQGSIAAGTSGTPSAFLPMAIKQRNAVPYTKDHRVTTMTVGVSLGGQYTDATSPKRNLFLAAVAGDPSSKSGLLTDFHGFNGWDQTTLPVDPGNDWIPDPRDPSNYPAVGKRRDGAVFFFDATDVDKLIRSMDYAFKIAVGSSANNATSSPNLPFTGATVGRQTYLGTFKPPSTGGAIWPGDLLMFGTRENTATGSVQIIDKNGNVATAIDSSTAQWSVATALNARGWGNRRLFTRLPGNATVPERGLHAFTDTGTAFTNGDSTDNTAGLQHYVAQNATNGLPVGGSAQFYTLRNAMGANHAGPLDNTGRPTTSRLNLMGDIIDSSPAALEYNIGDSTVLAAIASSTRLSAVQGAEKRRFRLILVGTNQGWVHGFGEVTNVSTVTDAGGVTWEIATGDVDELWAFMPTDFLPWLQDVFGQYSAGASHRFMADGTPVLYHLDLPPTGGGSGNGKVDWAGSERAVAVFGLRRGGRSYYALDVKDPLNPTLRWSLVPDEAAVLPASRNLTGQGLSTVQSILGRFGFSTCTPGLGRVGFTSAGTTKLRDAVFLGGGDSNVQIEANFKDAAGKTIPLGRALAAVDVYTGEILSTVDLTALPGVSTTLGNPSLCSIGPVPAGVIPFEFILNSGMAQRAYFMDYKGGLWAWGSKATADATLPGYTDYRVDTSDLAKWTTTGAVGGSSGVRKVFQDPTGNNALYSTLPAPFRVGAFPGRAKTSGAPAPAAVGVAMVSGNRNNPLDQPDPPLPGQHRLTVVFDRQDSRAWGLDSQNGPDTGIGSSNLKDFSVNTVSASSTTPCTATVWQDITPGCGAYYLAPAAGTPAFGYFINFPAGNGTFVPKGINPPIVVSGSLFFSYFTPTSADPCTGGTGTTTSKLVASVLSPITQDNRSGIANPSGSTVSWSGVASDFIAYGTRGVIQGGTVPIANPVAGGPQTTLEMKTMVGNPKERFPKPRVWRTIR